MEFLDRADEEVVSQQADRDEEAESKEVDDEDETGAKAVNDDGYEREDETEDEIEDETDDAIYEAENQAMLEHYQARDCTVVRNSKGQVVQAFVTYPDGTWGPIYHGSLRDVARPVSVTSSTRKSETPIMLSDVPASAEGVTDLGHREIAESEQQWEIHLRPKQDDSPKSQSPDQPRR